VWHDSFGLIIRLSHSLNMSNSDSSIRLKRTRHMKYVQHACIHTHCGTHTHTLWHTYTHTAAHIHTHCGTHTHTLWHTYTHQAVVLKKSSSQSALLCYDSCVCVTWLIRTFGITHPYVCHESVLFVMHEGPADAWNSDMTRSCTWYTKRWLFCACEI